jgi:hypothetical protein
MAQTGSLVWLLVAASLFHIATRLAWLCLAGLAAILAISMIGTAERSMTPFTSNELIVGRRRRLSTSRSRGDSIA